MINPRQCTLNQRFFWCFKKVYTLKIHIIHFMHFWMVPVKVFSPSFLRIVGHVTTLCCLLVDLFEQCLFRTRAFKNLAVVLDDIYFSYVCSCACRISENDSSTCRLPLISCVWCSLGNVRIRVVLLCFTRTSYRTVASFFSFLSGAVALSALCYRKGKYSVCWNWTEHVNVTRSQVTDG